MADTNSFDVIVVGGGPGGYVCAIRAAQLGLKTALVEKDKLGGVCLNWGCIPTKALLRSAEVWHLMHRLGEFGFSGENFQFDLAKMVARSRQVSARLSNGVGFLMKKHKIAVVGGTARLSGPGKLAVTGADGKTAEYAAKAVVLATGSRPKVFPGLEPDRKLIWTAREAMTPDAFPKRLLVVGSGAIGIEFASFYRTLGAEVTVVEVLDRILPVEDEEISALAHKAFVKAGMTIKPATTVAAFEKKESSLVATLKAKDGKEEKIEIDRAIMAVGIVGNVENLGLEELGVKIDRTHVAVDKYCQTNVPGIYAIGDLTDPPWLAHKAMHEGVIAAEKIAGLHPHPLDHAKVPGCTYCMPQIASIGLTEAKAKAAGRKIKVGRFPFAGNGKAIALGEPDGLIKTVFDAETGEMIGAHMIGAEVTELIEGYAVAMSGELTEAEIAGAVFPHPTLSEMMHEATLAADGKALHV
jgi:dihydrolipoamide dehydrogenase